MEVSWYNRTFYAGTSIHPRRGPRAYLNAPQRVGMYGHQTIGNTCVNGLSTKCCIPGAGASGLRGLPSTVGVAAARVAARAATNQHHKTSALQGGAAVGPSGKQFDDSALGGGLVSGTSG